MYGTEAVVGTLSECVYGHLELIYKVKVAFSKSGVFRARDSPAHGDSRKGVGFPAASHNFSRSMFSSPKTLDCRISLYCISEFVFIHICHMINGIIANISENKS